MTRIALHIHYLGHNFCGWQKQPGSIVTLQSSLETAASQIAGHSVEVLAAGRTDRGVHALGQVVHFDTNAHRSLHSWVYGINRYLPPDISVQSAQEVPSNFHARFSAHRRSYRYILNNDPIRPTHLKGLVGWCFTPVDIDLMNEAAQYLIGNHDFSSFRSSECQAKSPIKELYDASVYQASGLICFDFSASGFLHHMVRNIVGALIYIGSGKMTLTQWQKIIHDCDRRYAPPTFMPDGLYLTHVSYPNEFILPIRDLPQWFWGKSLFNK